ncbi:uncharacterized protein T551_03344 [Pneumocystis jirovecii RU7]|uniref:Uncharacterized protein n=1 Tax=Pneumocystis jirovecii (strain RU7) TaxID=1408657 RepID=A0A0W4ZEU7_PNEJ7|nr:uncharacterized protein T551_03344 [Pneumocystis jirovecii RU7]KTW26882.1 hypothetical protein T551_03344 [Pneumocystis jirovecii RU7]
MEFKPQTLYKRKQNDVSISGLIENRKKRLLETFSELTLNEGIHKLEVYKDLDMKYLSFYEKDAHTTVIENIENFTDNNEEEGKIESPISFLQGIKEKFVNIPNYILQPEEPVMDLILYKSPKYTVHEHNTQKEASEYQKKKNMPETTSIHIEKINDQDIPMHMDITY